MTNSSGPLHVYLREMKDGERTSLTVLASMIGPGSRVLDLGTGSGALGKFLHDNKQCTLDGVTFNAAEADQAASAYRRLEVANLDSCELTELFAGCSYDFIVCADILEHLREPERVLAASRELLDAGGKLLISVPNASYAGLLGELMLGDLRYREEGLLDRTHLRFFTRRSLRRFLMESGWAVDGLDVIEKELPDSEFGVAFDTLPPAVARFLLTGQDALTYQLIAAAHPKAPRAKGSADTLPESAESSEEYSAGAPLGAARAEARFTLELYRGMDGVYREDRKIRSSAVIGELRQTISLDIKADGAPWNCLRLDPADRPGFLHLHHMRLRDTSANVLWEWSALADDGFELLARSRTEGVVAAPAAMAGGSTLLLMHGENPWIELPIPAAVTMAGHDSRTENFKLELEIGWPMSADYLALAGPVAAHHEQAARAARAVDAHNQRALADLRSDYEKTLARERDEFRTVLEREREEAARALERERVEAVGALQQRQRDIAHADALLADERSRLRALTDQAALLMKEKSGLSRENTRLANQSMRLDQERGQLLQHLEFIEQSTVFRATRPLVNMKMRIDRLRSGAPAAVANAAPVRPEHRVSPGSEPVDVIVPVYRGLFDTRRCVDAVLSQQCVTPFRLVVLNDASPEPEVTEWLRERAATDSRMLLLENPENLGFVGTVNRGMALSDRNDVVLLNSDAEVANDWLDRMRSAAYRDARVASVTPFSNNATICSYPRFCEDNELPPGYNTAQLDALFARSNAGEVVDVPTGIGFCMYIRRDALAEVGLFDVETFGKGYGEENDFCRRADAAGWRNLHALDTFVMHAGGVSFGDAKSPREQAAMVTLRRLYPDYEPIVHRFVADDPARVARLRVDMERIRCAGLPVVVAVVHDRSGGTLRHVRELANELVRTAIFLRLAPVPGGVILERVGASEAFALTFQLPAETDDLMLALRSLGVVHLHFHHLIGHGDVVRELPARTGLAYDFTAHDYYTMCPQISLTRRDNAYCGEEGVDQCTACLKQSPAPGGVSIETWRANHASFVTRARHVLVPSRDAARRFARFLPQADVRFAPHTDVVPAELPPPVLRPWTPGRALRVVVLGALSPIKGADLLEDVAKEAARRGVPIEFHLLGYAYRTLKTQPHAALTVHGEYADKDLPRLLEWLQPDLAWFPARWPETYSYTLSACLEQAMPIVAPDIGAFPERLAGRAWPWLRPWDGSAEDFLAFFLKIREENFATATAPARLWQATSADEADVLVSPWSYAKDYLVGHDAPATLPSPLTDEFLRVHQHDRAGTAAAVLKQGIKRGLLTTLVRLRSARGLSRVARAIPLRWQTRIKTWLRG